MLDSLPDKALPLLQGLVVLLFVMAGLPMIAHRVRLRRAAIAAYVIALIVAVALVLRWLGG